MQPTFLPLIYVVAFIAVVLAIQSIAGLVFSTRERSQRVNRRLTMLRSGMKPTDVYAALVRRNANASLGNKRLLDFYELLAVRCRQAGLTLTPSRLLAIVAASTAALWILSMLLLKASPGAGFAFNAVLGLIGAAILSCGGAWIWINGQRARRLKKLEEQLPLALDVVVRAIRAGHPVWSVKADPDAYPPELRLRLSDFPLMRGLRPHALNALLAAADWFSLPGGAVLERAGENDQAVFLVVAGALGFTTSRTYGGIDVRLQLASCIR